MSPVALFLLGTGLTALASFSVVLYLKPHLKTILTDLCGSTERADFWTAFSNVILLLTPLIFALHYRPDSTQDPSPIFALATQLKLSLAGLITSVVILGLVISRFIPLSPPPNSLSKRQKE